jgi:hypothetical protein
MLEPFCDRRIKFSLESLLDRDAYIVPAEKRASAFAGYVRSLAAITSQSSLGSALLRAAVLQGVSVGLDPLLEPNSSYFYPQQNHFDLGFQPDLLQKSEKGVSQYLVSFVGGLRRAWLLHKGHAPDVSLRPDDFLKFCRCAEADAGAVTQLVAWELRSANAGFMWRHLLSGPDGDMSVIFERAIMEGLQSQFDGLALKAAFNQWFADRERIALCDHTALELIDMSLMQFGGPPHVGVRSLKLSSLQSLGSLPNGRNYLSGCLFMGGWYNMIEDEFNRTHLRHIERDIAQLIEKQHNI